MFFLEFMIDGDITSARNFFFFFFLRGSHFCFCLMSLRRCLAVTNLFDCLFCLQQEHERDGRRGFGGQTWAKLLVELGRLALSERVYNSLEFLEQRWFARKEVSSLFVGRLTHQ